MDISFFHNAQFFFKFFTCATWPYNFTCYHEKKLQINIYASLYA
jgi:hypothetical protein